MNRDMDQQEGIDWHPGDMPYSRRFGDHYYSNADGRGECEYVFLNGNGLPQRWDDGADFLIAELGFGTGLNFCETWRHWKQKQISNGRLTFVSFEKHLLGKSDISRALGVWPELALFSQQLLVHWSAATSAFVRIDFDDTIALELHVGDVHDCLPGWKDAANAWFLDGFAPARNPDMWSAELMSAVYQHTVPGGSVATYTSAGWVRRNLEAAGYAVEKRPGFGGKREMTVGTRRE
ncbi:MAG: tRNA (5-methylaminomethyl-2-thiouridine)(34)-methyltransferase MnmD [Pseudomonadota bacterium]